MAFSGHCLTIGMTDSGKTSLNKNIAAWYQSQGIKTIVLDPMHDDSWPADFKTDDTDEFMALVKDPERCLQCALFVDESGMSLNKYDTSLQWLTCQARHFGHITHIITQRAEQVDPNIREQCKTLFAFQVSIDDAKKYAKSWNNDLIFKAAELPQGHFVKAQRFGEVGLFKLPWAK